MPTREHEQAQEIAAAAGRLLVTGEVAEARRQYGLAADLELRAVDQVPREKRRTWGILAVSAAALLYKAHRHDEAENAIYSFLVQRDVPPSARQQLRDILEVIWDERALPPGYEYSGDEFLVTLRGGEVGSGTAPLDLVIEKNTEFRGLTTRAVEWQSRRPFRMSGPADALVAERVQARATQAVAGSYRFTVRLVAPAQEPLFADLPTVSVKGVADAVFTLIRHATSGRAESARELKRLVPDEQYRSTMLKLVRSIVPSGKRVGEVEITRITKGPEEEPVRTSVTLTKDSRGPVAEMLKATSTKEGTDEHVEIIRGTLRAVHLDKDWLIVVQDDGTAIKCEGAGASVDDILGPLVNRPVILRAHRRGFGRRLFLEDIEPDPDKG